MSTQQVLQIGGAVIGFYLGGPAGAQAGFMAGSVAAAFIPPEGPDPGDLAAPKIHAGSPMWRGFGDFKVLPSPIWMSDFHAHETGGKGGEPPGQYFTIDVLYRVCDKTNVQALLRVWVNENVEYCMLDSAGAGTWQASLTTAAWESIELRTGGPLQQSWSVHEDAEGAGNVSAQRGFCTIAIRGLNCGPSKSPPLVKVEVGTNATSTTRGIYGPPYTYSVPLDPVGVYGDDSGIRTSIYEFDPAIIDELGRLSASNTHGVTLDFWGDTIVTEVTSPPEEAIGVRSWVVSCYYLPGNNWLQGTTLMREPTTVPFITWTTQPVTLASIINAELSSNEAIDLVDFDTSLCEEILVNEYQCSGTPASAIAGACDIYFVNLVPGNPLRFVPLGEDVVATLTNAELGVGNGKPGDPFTGLKEDNDDEQSAIAGLQFPDRLNNHDPGYRSADRLTTQNPSAKVVGTFVGLLPSEAQGRAIALNLLRQNARYNAEISWSDRRSALQPGDAIRVPDEQGNLYDLFIRAESYSDGVHKGKVELYDVSALVYTGVTTETDNNAITVVAPAVADFLPLDIPLLDVAANEPGYLGLVKNGSSTAGMRWLDSPDGVIPYTERAAYVNDAVFGTVTAASGSFSMGVLFDEGSSLTVDVGDGQLFSATRDALLASRSLNAFAVGIDGRMVLGQFRDAALVSAGVYTLTGFVNMGAKDTQRYCADIAVDDDFALLDFAGTALIPRSVSGLGVPIYVKAVTNNTAAASVSPLAFTPDGVNMKPLAPVQLRVARDASSGDIELSATRQTRFDTRFGGPLGDACPLGEVIDQRQWRLYTDGTFTTVLRDLGITGNDESVTYTAAQRGADGLALYDPLYVDVRMLSAVVGEGNPLQEAA